MHSNDRCNVVTALAIAAAAFALPAQAFAELAKVDGFKAELKQAKERGPKDKITTTCAPGTADYDIDKCYEDIKGK